METFNDRGGGIVGHFTTFREGTARNQPDPGTCLTNQCERNSIRIKPTDHVVGGYVVLSTGGAVVFVLPEGIVESPFPNC